jgi:type IV pilus assembly protein PilE
MKSPSKRTGFTLMELLVVVAIVGILVAIAMPSYDAYLRRGSRSAAQAFMMQVAGKQAQYLLDARNYAVGSTAMTDLGLTVPPEVTPFYTVVVENSAGGTTVTTPPSYRVRATPISSSRQAPDGELILTDNGTKSRGGTAGW